MGFPVGYTEVFVPKLLLHLFSFLCLIRSFIVSVFNVLGLPDFLETDVYWPEHGNSRTEPCGSMSSLAIKESLPVMKMEELRRSGCGESFDSCVVCLCEIEEEEEIRWLKHCKHIFHRSCLDRWMDHDQKTCPLCRTPFLTDVVFADESDHHLQRLWAASQVGEAVQF